MRPGLYIYIYIYTYTYTYSYTYTYTYIHIHIEIYIYIYIYIYILIYIYIYKYIYIYTFTYTYTYTYIYIYIYIYIYTYIYIYIHIYICVHAYIHCMLPGILCRTLSNALLAFFSRIPADGVDMRCPMMIFIFSDFPCNNCTVSVINEIFPTMIFIFRDLTIFIVQYTPFNFQIRTYAVWMRVADGRCRAEDGSQ